MILKVLSIISTLFNVFNKTNTTASHYLPLIKEFVTQTADHLEGAIPDEGMGSTKLALFDGALKVFVDDLKNSEDLDDKVSDGIWGLAHFLLTGYIAAKKAKDTVE